MKKVMNLLYDIEEKANNIIERANDEKLSLHAQLDKDLANLDQEIIDMNKQKLDVLQSKIDQELEQKKELLISESKKQIEDINNYFIINHDNLVNKIFNNIIGA